MEVLEHDDDRAMHEKTGDQEADSGETRLLERLGAEAGRVWPPFGQLQPHDVSEQIQLFFIRLMPEHRLNGSRQRLESTLVCFVRAGAHPIPQELRVEPVRLSRPVRGRPALEPKRQAPGRRAHPGHEQPAAFA